MKNPLLLGVLFVIALFLAVSIMAGLACSLPYGDDPFAQLDSVIVVSPVGPWPTIQSAYNQAQAGETIYLWPGTYAEEGLTIAKAVNFVGFGRDLVTWIGDDTLFTLATDGATFSGIKLEATCTDCASIFSATGYEYIMNDCWILGQQASFGRDTVTINNSQIDLTVHKRGACGDTLTGYQTGHITFNGCTFGYPDACQNGTNTGTQYFGPDVLSGYVYLNNCAIYADSCGLHWAGQAGITTEVHVTNSYIEGTDYAATAGGQISDLWAYNSVFVNNEDAEPTVVAHDSANVHLFNCTVENLTTGTPTAIKITSQGTSDLVNCVVSDCVIVADSETAGNGIVNLLGGFACSNLMNSGGASTPKDTLHINSLIARQNIIAPNIGLESDAEGDLGTEGTEYDSIFAHNIKVDTVIVDEMIIPDADKGAKIGTEGTEMDSILTDDLVAEIVTVNNQLIPDADAGADIGTAGSDFDSLFVDDIVTDIVTVNTNILPDANEGADIGTAGTIIDSIFVDDIVADIATINSDVLPDAMRGADIGTAEAAFDSVFADKIISIAKTILTGDTLFFDSGTDTYLDETNDDSLALFVGGQQMMLWEEGAADVVTTRVGVAYTPSTTQTYTDDQTITVDNKIILIGGSGGAAVLDADPAIEDGAKNGQEIILIGTHNTNTVQIADNCNIQLAGGTAVTLGLGDILYAVWSSVLNDWVMVCTSDN